MGGNGNRNSPSRTPLLRSFVLRLSSFASKVTGLELKSSSTTLNRQLIQKTAEIADRSPSWNNAIG